MQRAQSPGVAYVDVAIELPEAAAHDTQITRWLQQFEDLCVVTGSVRQGVAVDVSVRGAAGVVLHASEPA